MSQFISRILSKISMKELIKFIIVGAIGTVVNLSILYILTELFGVYYIISETIAFIISVINNYILNKIWTFEEKIEEEVMQKYLQYLVISLIALGVNLMVLYILVEYFGFWYILAEVGAIAFAFVISFTGNKFWTFNEKLPENSVQNEPQTV